MTWNWPLAKISWSSLQLSFRATVAAVLALVLARWFELAFPIYAFIAAVIVTDLEPSTSRKLGWRRIVATMIGALCGAVLSFLLPPGPLGVGFGFLVAMLLAQLLGTGEGSRVAGYICGIVMLDHSADPWHYAFHRLIETMFGVIAAWSISYVPKVFKFNDSSSRVR
jgi:uncharacterized membrane protein YgaE (UPF0421/DUF939 family)